MKILKPILIGFLVIAIIKAFNIFENAGELDSNANVFAFAGIVSFFVLLIFLILFSGIKTKKLEGPKPMATQNKQSEWMIVWSRFCGFIYTLTQKLKKASK